MNFSIMANMYLSYGSESKFAKYNDSWCGISYKEKERKKQNQQKQLSVQITKLLYF